MTVFSCDVSHAPMGLGVVGGRLRLGRKAALVKGDVKGCSIVDTPADDMPADTVPAEPADNGPSADPDSV